MSKIKSGAFKDYKGNTQFKVEHPQMGTAIVVAPNEDAALVAAAEAFGVPWTKVEFYSYCTITMI